METEAGQKPDQNKSEGHASHATRLTGSLTRFAWVLLAVALSSLIVAPFAYSAHGNSGLVAAFLAATVCLLAAGLGGFVSSLFQHSGLHPSGSSAASVLLAMFVRMGLPLAVCMVVHLQDGWLSHSGFALCLLVYYPVALAIETWSDVGMISRSQTISGGA